MKILGIDTSCDETSIAIINANGDFDAPEFETLSNIISSQIKIHQEWGGVFPALAKREHQNNLAPVLLDALRTAQLLKEEKTQISDEQQAEIKKLLEREQSLADDLLAIFKNYAKPDIDLIAVTTAPGLEPCLWVGINFAKAISYFWNIKLTPINHIESHLLANYLNGNKQQIKYPAIALIVSGGHTQLILMNKIGEYKIIGKTLDDAAGECFDKVARILSLGYPGGPIIEKIAQEQTGKEKKYNITLPRPMLKQKSYDFSFSGLKTAVLYEFKKQTPEIQQDIDYKNELATEAQNAILDVLIKKTILAAKEHNAQTVILGGGVTASNALKQKMQKTLSNEIPGIIMVAPEIILSTDNAAMVAVTGFFHKSKVLPYWENDNFVAKSRVDI